MPQSVGPINTNLMVIKLGAAVIGCATDVSLNVQQEMRDTTCRDAVGSWKAMQPGIKSWDMNGSFLYSVDAAMGAGGLFTNLVNGTKVQVEFASTNTGDEKYTGDAYIGNVQIQASGIGQNATFSAKLEGTGPLTKAAS